MKEILLKPDSTFFNYVDVSVIDFPNGVSEGTERRRCRIQVEFAKVDVEQLKKRGLDYAAAIQYYRDYIYKLVKVNLAMDWECIGGMDELMKIVEDHVKPYYEESPAD